MMLCPRCGTANPDSSEFCTSCRQALPDGATLQRPQFEEPKWGEDSVPDWLLDLQENLPEELRDHDIDQMVRQRALASVQPIAPPLAERDEETSVVETEVSPEVEAESTEWFNDALSPMEEGTPALEEEPATSREAANESEAWLDSLLSSEEDVPASAVEATEASQDTGAAVLAGETADQTSDWLDDLRGSIDEVADQQETDAQPTGDREIPDRLPQESFDDAIGEWDAIPSATSETEVLPQIQRSTTSSVEEQALPDWLPTVQPSYRLEEEEAPGAAEKGQPAEVPEWLRSITEPYAQTTDEMSLVDDAVPDWLRTEPEEESGLLEETQSDTTETAAVAGSAVDADMPEWLLTLEGEGRPFESDDAPADSDDTAYPDNELPDWLRDTAEAHTSSEEDLEGQQIVEGETVAFPRAEETATEPEHLEITEEIPGEAETTPSSQTFEVSSEGPPQIRAEAYVAEIAQAATVGPDHPETPEERPVVGEEDGADTSSQAPQEDLTEPVETVSAAAGLAGVAALAGQPSDSGGEIPEWIQGLAEQIQSLPLAEEDEVSLLERTEVGGTASLSHATPGAATGEASEIPEWLRDLRDQEPLEDMAPPTWLTEPEAESPTELPGEEIPHVREETPGWLAGPSPVEKDGTAEDLPEWLRDLDMTEEELSQEIPGSEGEEVPSWLKRMSAPEASHERTKTTHAEEVAIPEAGDELSEARSLPSEQPTLGAPILPFPSESSLAEAAPTEAMESISRQEATTALTTDYSLQELHGKESAILAGIGAALSVEPAISAVKPGQRLMPQAVPEETEQARILQEIASQPLVPGASVIGRKRSRLWGTLGRIIIYLLIIAAVVVPLYWQGALGIGFISEYNIPISNRTQNVYERINTLPEQSLALLVVDYEPSLAEELNTQARTLLQNLMQRQHKILLVSTTLTGPQVIQDIMEELVRKTESNYEYGEDYLNLGYLPGQEASLLLFGRSPLAAVRVDFRDGQNLSSYPVAADLRDVPQEGLGQVIPLIINLTGNQENLRVWIEQVLAANDNVTMIAGVSAGLEAYVYPYLESGQLAGLMSGLTGAAEYESLTEKPGRAIRSVDSQIAVHLLIVGLIVLGNVGYVLKRIVTRR